MKRLDKKGFSLVEMIVVVLMIGIFAAVSVPRINFASIAKKGPEVVASKLMTDLRRTRSLAINNAATNSDGYQLKINPLIAKAITEPRIYTAGLFSNGNKVKTKYYTYDIIRLDKNRIVETHDGYEPVVFTGGLEFSFGPLGNLTSAGSTLTIRAEGEIFAINITASTGHMRSHEKERVSDDSDGSSENQETYPPEENDPVYGE
jgi:prepilin-type N-terminal cleavage/methylation domain-containing protein